MSILNELAAMGMPAREVLSCLAPELERDLPADSTTSDIWQIIANIVEPPMRKKLPQYNTIEDAIKLIRSSSKVLVLSGAGISTSAGLPDFRSRDGLYVQIHEKHPDLSDPKLIFDIDYFKQNPLPFYQFAKALFPGQFAPTVGHQFIKCLEDHKKLLRNYTQNIDTLEKLAGIKRTIECHGSFATASCTSCSYSFEGHKIKRDVFEQRVPKCPRCRKLEGGPQDGLGVMKPDIVFFGEQLAQDFHDSLESDKKNLDLLIVIGSSLKVRPVSLIPRTVSPNIPQILINREPLDMSFDIELLGDCDQIIQELCFRLGDGWIQLCNPLTGPLHQIDGSDKLILSDNRPAKASKKLKVTNEKQPRNKHDENKSTVSTDCDNNHVNDSKRMEKSNDQDVAAKNHKFDLLIPDDQFVHIKPNRYFFKGAELTSAQYKQFIGPTKQSSQKDPLPE